MILTLPDLVTPDELALIKQKIATVPFIEGKATAGELLKSVKNNQQIPWNHPVMKEITDLVMRALGRCDAFMSLAQPRRLAAMLVSRYEPGMAYGAHVDAPIMGEPNHVRSDVSFTLFLNEPDTYQGGELAFENGSGETAFKLPGNCTGCGRSNRVNAWPWWAGCRAWCGNRPSANCCMTCPKHANCWSARKAPAGRWSCSPSPIPTCCVATPNPEGRLELLPSSPRGRG